MGPPRGRGGCRVTARSVGTVRCRFVRRVREWAVVSCLLAAAAPAFGAADIVDKLLPSDGQGLDEFGISVDVSGDLAVVGAWNDDDNGTDSGSAYVFRFDGTSWVEEVKLLASDGAEGDNFGYAAAVAGNVVVVGARDDQDNGFRSGSVYVFRYDYEFGSWMEATKLTAFDGAPGDRFGISVGMDGAYVAVGAMLDDDDGTESGSVYVYRGNGQDMVWEAKLRPTDGKAEGRFGSSVDVSGNRLAVGARGNGVGSLNVSGGAYVFRRDGLGWSQDAKLMQTPATHTGDGPSVGIDWNLVVVGSPLSSLNGVSSGTAHVFRRGPVSWSHEAVLAPSDATPVDRFGASVGVSDGAVLVGSPFDDDRGTDSGSAYVFRFDRSQWVEEYKLKAFFESSLERFGNAVRIEDGVAFVGSHFDDETGYGSGSVYVWGIEFETFCGNGLVEPEPDCTGLGGDDTDRDGVCDAVDNCLLVQNGGVAQCDGDSDGFGNACDGDFDNDGFVTPVDTAAMSAALAAFESEPPGVEDMNCDGFVTPMDVPRFYTQIARFFPGPTGLGEGGAGSAAPPFVEECDDGNTVSGDGCSAGCLIEICGNGLLDPGEECDDGDTTSGDGCSAMCVREICGNSVLDAGEQCDDGNTLSGDGCDRRCVAEFCGDGGVQPGIGEECDDGNTVAFDGCNEICIFEHCRDGITHPALGEECDDGNTDDVDFCDNFCRITVCGDGVTNGDDECDDGNGIDADFCRNDCSAPYCGDGLLNASEECDDWNDVDDDFCSNACVLARCGDGVTNALEGCDDGNTESGDGCSQGCAVEPQAAARRGRGPWARRVTFPVPRA